MVLHHCNEEENEHIQIIAEQLIKDYVHSKQISGLLVGVTGVQLLRNLCNVWDHLVIFSLSMDRLFQYLNVNHLKCFGLPSVSGQVLTIFRRKIYQAAWFT